MTRLPGRWRLYLVPRKGRAFVGPYDPAAEGDKGKLVPDDHDCEDPFIAWLGLDPWVESALTRAGIRMLSELLALDELKICAALTEPNYENPLNAEAAERATASIVKRFFRIRSRLDVLGHKIPGKRHTGKELYAHLRMR